jgi:hypothetical protein
MKVVRSSPLRTSRLYPRVSWYSFLEAESTPAHMVPSVASEKEIPSDIGGDRSRDPPTSSGALTTTLPQAPTCRGTPIIKRFLTRRRHSLQQNAKNKHAVKREIRRLLAIPIATAADCCHIYKLKAPVIETTHKTNMYLKGCERALLPAAFQVRSDI